MTLAGVRPDVAVPVPPSDCSRTADGSPTLARQYAHDHPLTLVLDIDQVRGMLGRWLDQPTDAGVLARDLAVAMARTQLDAGRDVLVPQYLGRLEFVETLQQLASEVGAAFIECALLGDRNDVVARFERRSATSADPAHQQAAELQRRTGGREQLAATHGKVLAVVAARPATRVITTIDGDIDGAYTELLDAIAPGSEPGGGATRSLLNGVAAGWCNRGAASGHADPL